MESEINTLNYITQWSGPWKKVFTIELGSFASSASIKIEKHELLSHRKMLEARPKKSLVNGTELISIKSTFNLVEAQMPYIQ